MPPSLGGTRACVEHPEPGLLQPAGDLAEQQQVLEHAAGQRHRAQPVTAPAAPRTTSAMAAATPWWNRAAMTAGAAPSQQVLRRGPHQVGAAHPQRASLAAGARRARLDRRRGRRHVSAGSASCSSSIAAWPS